MITSSPVYNILSKVYYEKTRLSPDMLEERELLGQDRCLVTRDLKMLKLIKMRVFVMAERKVGDWLLSVPFVVEGMPKKIWLSDRATEYSYPLVIYYSRESTKVGKQ